MLQFPSNDEIIAASSSTAAVSDLSSPTTTTSSLPLPMGVNDSGKTNNKTLVEIWKSLIQKELSICTKIAEKYPKNYYAWTHRRWMIQQIVSKVHATEEKSGASPSSNFYSSYLRKLIYEEFTFIVRTWLPRHVSDHSAVHYGQQMLYVGLELFGMGWKASLTCTSSVGVEVSDSATTSTPKSTSTTATSSLPDDDVPLYQLALSSSQVLTNQFPDHEALWIFRRQVVTTILSLYFQTSKITDKDFSDLVWNQLWESHIRQLYLEAIGTKLANSNSVSTDTSDASATITTGGCFLQPSSLVYSWTYLLWVLHHIQRFQQQNLQAPIVKATDAAATDDLILSMYRTTWNILHHYSKSCCLLSPSSADVGTNGNGIIGHRLWEDKS